VQQVLEQYPAVQVRAVLKGMASGIEQVALQLQFQ
jgi:hypothetical protein